MVGSASVRGGFTARPELAGHFGVAASTHWLASGAAMAMLEQGGNAFDAAAAAGFVLQVVEPHLNGPGGEVPILLHDTRQIHNRLSVICGQGVVPAAASIEEFTNKGLTLVPATGLLPAVVPGAFGAWLMLLADHGSMSLADVLAPAIRYAEKGYPLVPKIANALQTVQAMFREHWPSSAAVYCAQQSVPESVPEAGDWFANPALGACYRRILSEASASGGGRERQIEAARRAWYEGFVAEAIDDFYRTADLMDSTGDSHGGLLSGNDLAAWQATRESPALLDYADCTIAKCGLWSQGPVMLQQLAQLEGAGIADMGDDEPAFIHALTESAKLAFADREAWYGDTDDQTLRLRALLDPARTAERRALMTNTASADLRPGDLLGKPPAMPEHRIADPDAPDLAALLGMASRPAAHGDTCHIDVIDRWGNMVAATPSGGWFQSSPVVPGLGFSISTRAQMCWLQEGLPSTLTPGRRPRTTLTPSMALRDGMPWLAWGTPGGDQQDQWSLSFLLRHLHHGLNLQEAIEAPSFHSEHWQSSFWPREAKPNRLVLEGQHDPHTVDTLRAFGHDVELGEDWSEGRLSACARVGTGEQRRLYAAANPRGMQGYAAGR